MNYKEYRPVMKRTVREKSLKDSDVALSVGALDVTESFTNGLLAQMSTTNISTAAPQM